MNLLNKIKEIYDGWKNLVNKKVTIEDIARVRKNICRTNKCGFYMTKPYRGCSECMCPERAKIRSLRTKCPENYFGYAHELKLLLTEQLLDDLTRFRKKQSGDVIIYSDKEFRMDFDVKMKVCTFRHYPEQEPVKYWNELCSFYKLKIGKRLF